LTSRVSQAEAGARDRVVGRLLVGGQRDLFGEFGRHGVAVRQHMADMARGQPEAHDQRQNEENTNKIENASEYILCL
jgi:hypothetical protein